MKNNINYAALSMNDIIFQGRNKDYGAYELRESYNRRIKQSIMGAMFLTVLACSYQILSTLRHPIAQHVEKEITTTMTDLEKPALPKEAVKPPEPVQPPKPQGTPDPVTVASAVLVPTTNDQATDSVPTNDMLAQNNIGDHTGGTDPGINVGTPDGTADISVHTPPAAVAVETVDYAQTMPEYPGGEKALMKFLSENISYPEIDRAMGNQGRVNVGFVIDENGNVTDIKIQRGLTRTLDAESVRVVSRLKTFKPGMQGGRKVRVRYSLPINYTLGEE